MKSCFRVLAIRFLRGLIFSYIRPAVSAMAPVATLFKAESGSVIQSRMRLAPLLMGVLLMTIIPPRAAEAASGSIKYPNIGTAMVNLTFSSTIAVPNNPAVGQVLQTADYNVGISASNVTCPVTETAAVNGTLVPGTTNIYMTSVPGLGVRYSITKDWNGSFVTAPYSASFPAPGSAVGPHYLRAELVVTGPVASGVLTTIPSLAISFSGSCIDTVSRTQYVTTGSTAKASTCNVTTSSIQVPLVAGVSPTSLASTGATAGATRFSIGLNCAAPANAYLSLSDASDPTNRSTVLSAAPSSTTKGVGVQISSESTVLSFGPTTAEKGMTATLMARMKAGANLIPLIARYARTGPVSPGKLSAMATFTLSYQ